jgi:hypothetical protein
MQRTSRTPQVVADKIDNNVVRFPPRSAAATADGESPIAIETLPALMERASNAARQIRYFALATRRFSYDELIPSAARAGFCVVEENSRSMEAAFRWGGAVEPDLIFSVSYGDPAGVAIVAESQADIFGLVITAYSHIATITVETSPTVENTALGPNALLFRDLLLTFPDFDEMPAWTKYSDRHWPGTRGLLEMWRDGVSLAAVAGWTWDWIRPRAFATWGRLRDQALGRVAKIMHKPEHSKRDDD